MSYALGQSQTPWARNVSEVDLPPNLHFRRWGPVSGLGQIPGMPPGFNPVAPILNTIDPLNLFHGQQQPGGAQLPPSGFGDQMTAMLPLLGLLAVGGGVLWYVLKK